MNTGIGETGPFYEVVWPSATKQRREQRLMDRPPSLDGKKVGFVWDYIFKGDRIFELTKKEMSRRFDHIQFVDYPVFGNIHGTDKEERSSVGDLPTRLADLEVDAVVVGVGA